MLCYMQFLGPSSFSFKPLVSLDINHISTRTIRLMFILKLRSRGLPVAKSCIECYGLYENRGGTEQSSDLQSLNSRFLIFDFKRSFGLFCCVSSSSSCYVLLRFRLLSKVMPSWIHFRLQTSNCFRLQTYRVDFRLKIWDLWYQREELIQQHARIASEVRNHQRMLSEVWSLKSLLCFRIIDIIFLSVKYCFW